MGDIRTRRFHWLKPGTIYTFSVQAISGSAQSDPATISLKTTGEIGMTWPKNAKIMARPVFWSRTIVVKWTLMNEPLRMDNYRLFRKGGSMPSPSELADYTTGNAHYLKDCGRWAYHTDHLTGTVMGLSDFGKEIEQEIPYYYWVWAFDKTGRQSATPLGPDVAEFGKPNKPKFKGGTTQVHERNKWWCDYKITWECVGGCEHYLLQRKLKGFLIWGPTFMVQHDESLGEGNQQHTFDNLLCSKEYDFRVRAVNIPFVFVSDWAYATYKTGEDTTRPNEIEYVAARRLYHGRKLFGEHIKLTWKRPTNAIIEQQVDYYRIYRKKGTDAEANDYKHQINISADANAPEKPEPYSESTKFHGTYFTDDDLEPLPAASGGGGFQGVSLCDFEAPTTDLTVDGAALAGTLTGTIATSTDYAHNGSYSLKSGAAGSGFSNYLEWVSNDIINLNEGYLTFYFLTTNLASITMVPLIRTREYAGSDYIALFYFDDRAVSSNIKIRVEKRVGATLVTWDYVDVYDFYPALQGTWIKVDFRWDTSLLTNAMSMRVNDGTWHYRSGTLGVSAATATGIRFGGDSSYAYYFDELAIYDNYEGVATELDANIYYHYWVTAVDIIGLESLVSGPEDENEGTASYDKVSFSPPPEPTNVEVQYNTALNVLSVKLMAAKFSWDAIDEATHFRVKMRTRPLGTKANGDARDFSQWFSSPYLREERIDDPDGSGKFYTWPWPLLQRQEIEYTVLAFNAAGESPYSKHLDIVGPDTIPPTEIQNIWGRCYGMYSLLWRKLWIGVKLTWDDLSSYEGVKLYQVEIYNTLTHEWDFATNAHPTVGNKKVVAWDPGQPIADSHRFRVRAVDWDWNKEDIDADTNHAGPWKEITIPWLQWWKLASS